MSSYPVLNLENVNKILQKQFRYPEAIVMHTLENKKPRMEENKTIGRFIAKPAQVDYSETKNLTGYWVGFGRTGSEEYYIRLEIIDGQISEVDSHAEQLNTGS